MWISAERVAKFGRVLLGNLFMYRLAIKKKCAKDGSKRDSIFW